MHSCINALLDQQVRGFEGGRHAMASAVADALREYYFDEPLEKVYKSVIRRPEVESQLATADGRFRIAKSIFLYGRHGKRGKNEASTCDYVVLRLYGTLDNNPFLAYYTERAFSSFQRGHGTGVYCDLTVLGVPPPDPLSNCFAVDLPGTHTPIAKQLLRGPGGGPSRKAKGAAPQEKQKGLRLTTATDVMFEHVLTSEDARVSETLDRLSIEALNAGSLKGQLARSRRRLQMWLERQWVEPKQVERVLGPLVDALQELQELHAMYTVGKRAPAAAEVRELAIQLTPEQVSNAVSSLSPFNAVTALVVDALVDSSHRGAVVPQLARLDTGLASLGFLFERVRNGVLSRDEARQVLYDLVLFHMRRAETELGTSAADIVQRLATLLLRLRDVGALSDDYGMLFQAFVPWSGRVREAHRLAFAHIGG